jgi:hypothetical protein
MAEIAQKVNSRIIFVPTYDKFLNETVVKHNFFSFKKKLKKINNDSSTLSRIASLKSQS